MSQNCPKCGKKMMERKGKFGSFLGCSGYPRCKTTMQIGQTTEKKSLRKIKSPSIYQSNIFDFVQNDIGNAVIKDPRVLTNLEGKTVIDLPIESLCGNTVEHTFDNLDVREYQPLWMEVCKNCLKEEKEND